MRSSCIYYSFEYFNLESIVYVINCKVKIIYIIHILINYLKVIDREELEWKVRIMIILLLIS